MGKLEIHRGQFAALEGARIVFSELYGDEKTEEFWSGACADIEKEAKGAAEYHVDMFCTHFKVRLWNDNSEREILINVGVIVEDSRQHGEWVSGLCCAYTQGLEDDTFDPETTHWQDFVFPDKDLCRGFKLRRIVPRRVFDTLLPYRGRRPA